MLFRSRLQIATKLDDALARIGPEAELALFRAAQEALANVVRHAEATHVTLTLTGIGRNLRLTVADDGRGFAVGSDIAAFERDGHLGLAGMRERITALGGTVQVSGASGVTVVVEVPVVST